MIKKKVKPNKKYNDIINTSNNLWIKIQDKLKDKKSKEYAFTFVAEGVLLISGLVCLKLSASLFGVEGFAEYSIARRAISLINFTILIGLGISIPRYIALSHCGDKREFQDNYFIAALIFAALMIGGLFCVSFLFPSIFSLIFFGAKDKYTLIYHISIAVAGLYLHSLIYAYFRGHLEMWAANFLQILNLGIGVPAAIILSGDDPSKCILIIGLWWLLVDSAILIYILAHLNLQSLEIKKIKKSMKELICYGSPRVIGEFALFGLFAVPTFIIANKIGIKQAGFFSFGLSLLQLMSSIFAIIGIILLPYISRLHSIKKWKQIKRTVNFILVLSLICVLLFVIIGEAVLEYAIILFMGESFRPAIAQIRSLIIGAIPYVIYIVLRNPIDAIAVWPYNSINLAITFIIANVLVFVGHEVIMPGMAMAGSLFVLGMLTLLSWKKCSMILKSEELYEQKKKVKI